jgi:hypothetical protein
MPCLLFHVVIYERFFPALQVLDKTPIPDEIEDKGKAVRLSSQTDEILTSDICVSLNTQNDIKNTRDLNDAIQQHHDTPASSRIYDAGPGMGNVIFYH